MCGFTVNLKSYTGILLAHIFYPKLTNNMFCVCLTVVTLLTNTVRNFYIIHIISSLKSFEIWSGCCIAITCAPFPSSFLLQQVRMYWRRKMVGSFSECNCTLFAIRTKIKEDKNAVSSDRWPALSESLSYWKELAYMALPSFCCSYTNKKSVINSLLSILILLIRLKLPVVDP